MTHDDRIAEVLGDWFASRDAEQPLDPEELIRANPDLATELRDHFRFMDAVGATLAEEPEAPSADHPARLGPFRVLDLLGTGGMGTVYLAEALEPVQSIAPGDRVALKVMHPHLFRSPGFYLRFVREGELGMRLRHENVVRTLAVGSVETDRQRLHYLAMEPVEGQTLSALLCELGRVPEPLVRHVAVEVAKGLQAIHDGGAVHRDLKPENVLITDDHVVKIMDLGVARLADEVARLSQTGQFVGSVAYAAPEQLRLKGDAVDHRADLHAVGILLHELLTGINPFRRDDFPEVLRAVLESPPPRVSGVLPGVSPFLEEVILALLEKEPSNRISSAVELLTILAEDEAGSWWETRSEVRRGRGVPHGAAITVSRSAPVTGREEEVAVLTELAASARAARGRVVLIEGEAGIGKTRLVDHFVSGVEEHVGAFQLIYCPCSGSTEGAGGGAFATAFRTHIGARPVAEAASGLLREAPALIPAFASLLQGIPAPEGALAFTAEAIQTAFVHAARALAEERPTLIVVDDLHDATSEERAIFAAIARGIEGNRVLLVGTRRQSTASDWWGDIERRYGGRRMTLGRLGAKDLLALTESVLDSRKLVREFSYLIASKSDGNPFFALEIIEAMQESGAIRRREDGSWDTSQHDVDFEVPSAVEDLVQSRLSSLGRVERDLLDVAACIGFEFDAILAGAALDLRPLDTLRLLGAIERDHRLVHSKGRRFVFDHHLVFEVLGACLSEPLREAYHGAIAEFLEAQVAAQASETKTEDVASSVRLCRHLLQAGQGERALRYLDAALDHLDAGYLNDQAIALADRALEVKGLLEGTARVDVLLKKNACFDLLGQRDAQEALLTEAETLAEEAGDDEVRGKVVTALGVVYTQTSRHEEAEASLRRALLIAQVRCDQKAEARATGNLGSVFCHQYRLTEAKEQFERDLALSREIGDRRGEARATGNLGFVFSEQGRLTEAKAHYERGLEIALELGNRPGEAITTGNLGIVFKNLGRYEEAKARHERDLEISREIGDRQGESRAMGNLGNVFQRLGRYAEAKEHGERFLALSREVGYQHHEAIALTNLGSIWLALGDRSQARGALDRSLAICREIGSPSGEGFGLHGLGIMADEEGDQLEALRLMEESLALRREIGHGHGVADSLIALADLHRRAGDADHARAALDEALSLAREQERPLEVAMALSLLACLPGGDAKAAESALDDAGETNERIRLRFLLHQVTGDRAHLEEAKRLLDEALSKVPEVHHEAMLTNVRINREIMQAWNEQAAS